MQLSNFKQYVKYDFKREDKDTELVQAYNDSIMYVASLMPYGNYKYQSYLATVVGQEDYPLPSTMNHLIHPIRILDGSDSTDSGGELNRLTKQKYDERYPNPNRTSPTTGYPEDYCIYSRSILLGPIPDSADYLLEVDWSVLPTALSADIDTPSLGREWEEILKQMILYRLYSGLGQYDEASFWRSQYEDGAGNPIGQFKRLLAKEADIEGHHLGQVKSNNL